MDGAKTKTYQLRKKATMKNIQTQSWSRSSFITISSNLIKKNQQITFPLVSMAIDEFVMLGIIKVFLQYHNTTQFEDSFLSSLQPMYVLYKKNLHNIM